MRYWKLPSVVVSIFILSLLLIPYLSIPPAVAESPPLESKLVDVPVPTAPHEVSSTLCAQCHATIYDEWKQSMHAMSTALTDPIHEMMYRQVIGDPTQENVTVDGKYPACLNCHAPNAAIQKSTKLDAKPSFNEGVNCIACHTISGFKGVHADDGKLRLGVAAYDISKTSLQAPSGKNYTTNPAAEPSGVTAKPFHPYPMEGRAPLFKSNDMCMGCHDQRNNSHGIPVCATGNEYRASHSSVTCQSCHMPVVNGRVSHRMTGGHDQAMVRRGIIVTLKVEPHSDSSQLLAQVTLKNQLPHNFPTGAPFRNVYLQLTAYDAQGQELWKNFQTHPLKEDKKAVLVYVMGDGQGKPTSSVNAKEIISDSRLSPHEQRTLEYQLPAEKVKLVRAELMYNLVLPEMIKHLEPIVGKELISPQQAGLAEVEL